MLEKMNIVERLESLDGYEEMESVDYADPNNNNGVPFLVDSNMSIPYARAANAKEGWVDVYVIFGMDTNGKFFVPAVDLERKECIMHRVYSKIKILKVDAESGIFINKKTMS